MNRIRNMWRQGAVMLVAVALLAPGPALAQAQPGSPPQVKRENVAKDLGLTPEKAKVFLGIGDKYDRMRQGVIAEIQKNEGELAKALAAPKPNPAQIKGLVTSITMDHDKLLDSFRGQRREEMDLLTPIQQGKFLMVLKKWHQQMCAKYEKPGPKK